MAVACVASELAPSRKRYLVVAGSFLLAVILYLDRAALSVTAPSIRRELGLTPMEMGWVFSAFVWGYALFHIPAGRLVDRWGPRRVLTIIVVIWSLFTALTGTAWNFSSLLVIRFLFGAAEAGATPSISRAFGDWIPVGERARAQGTFFSGMSAGSALTPPLVTLMLLQFGWRACFPMLAVVGLFWAAGWHLWYRDAGTRIATASKADAGTLIAAASKASAAPVNWSVLLRKPNLWAILLMYFTYGYTGYIFISWFPAYLIEARHMPVYMAGLLAAVPSFLGMFAKPLGGWWSDWLTRRRGVTYGRRLVGMVGFGLGAAAFLPGVFAENVLLAVLLLAIADAGAALAHGVCFAVCLDVGLPRAGTVSALMLTMGSLGNALSALAFGWFLQSTGSWVPPFVIAAVANLAGALLWLKIDPKKAVV